jgi:hypothetical protein
MTSLTVQANQRALCTTSRRYPGAITAHPDGSPRRDTVLMQERFERLDCASTHEFLQAHLELRRLHGRRSREVRRSANRPWCQTFVGHLRALSAPTRPPVRPLRATQLWSWPGHRIDALLPNRRRLLPLPPLLPAFRLPPTTSQIDALLPTRRRLLPRRPAFLLPPRTSPSSPA